MDEEPFEPLPDEAGTSAESEPARTLPDIAFCRARRSGIGGLVYCLVPASDGCPFAERHAFNSFCFHPESEAIITRTEA